MAHLKDQIKNWIDMSGMMKWKSIWSFTRLVIQRYKHYSDSWRMGRRFILGKVITILKNAGHKVIAVNMPLHNLADDVATVKRAIELVGKPVILVGHSYGGEVITNAGYNNPNVTGLVYIAAFVPDEGQSLSTFVSAKDFPQGFLMVDSAGLSYINPAMFHEHFAQDVKQPEADIMVVAQKPFNVSNFDEKSGPPAWKQLPTWYQISTSDLMIPPAVQQKFAKQMNATTLS
jgi:pimeloyl-ACP methyl ester carboxylesterase